MLWRMANMYREHVIAWGITNTGTVIEFWQGDNGSWTLLVSTAARACIASFGGGGQGI